MQKPVTNKGVRTHHLMKQMIKHFLFIWLGVWPAGELLSESTLFYRTVAYHNDTLRLQFVSNAQLFEEGWNKLSHVRFWQNIISLPSDSIILNVAANRQELHRLLREDWHCMSDEEKEKYRSDLRQAYRLDEQALIYATAGKREFYEFKNTLRDIDKAIKVFIREGVDPWYAQAILLIESPGKYRQKSSAGAMGPFQLMRSVAIRHGLRVNKYVDERTHLAKSARIAARLLQNVCIPYLKNYLTDASIPFKEQDLWFRLLVMHVYHAGWANVKCMLDQINPTTGGISLFQKIWNTRCRGFRNESQNYTQIALAAICLFEELLNQDKDTVFLVRGDRLLALHHQKAKHKEISSASMVDILNAYQQDLLDGVIPFDYFLGRIEQVHQHMAMGKAAKSGIKNQVTAGQLPLTHDEALHLGNKLIQKRRADEAVRLLQLHLKKHPYLVAAYDSLSRAYQMLGRKDLAIHYRSKSEELKSGLQLFD